MFITDNPDRDFDRWDREQTRAMARIDSNWEDEDEFGYEMEGDV